MITHGLSILVLLAFWRVFMEPLSQCVLRLLVFWHPLVGVQLLCVFAPWWGCISAETGTEHLQCTSIPARELQLHLLLFPLLPVITLHWHLFTFPSRRHHDGQPHAAFSGSFLISGSHPEPPVSRFHSCLCWRPHWADVWWAYQQ